MAALSGALDDEQLAAVIGALDGNDLAQLNGALDGPELAMLGGALDGVDLATVLGALDVHVVTSGGDDQVQTQLAGAYTLGDGENLYVATLDGMNIAQLGGALDREDLATLLGSLDGDGLVELIASLDGASLAAMGGALDGDQLRSVLEGLRISVTAGADVDQLQTALAGNFNLGDGDNLFIASLDGDSLAALAGALDSNELVALTGALDGSDLVALGGAMDGPDLFAVVSQWSVDVVLGDGDDQVQTEFSGTYNLGGANVDLQDADNRNLFIGILNGEGYASLGGPLDADHLAALIGTMDAPDLAMISGALDSDQLKDLVQLLKVTVFGGENEDQIFTSLPGSYSTGAGSDLFIGNLDGTALAELGGKLDSGQLRAEVGTTDTSELVALGGALDTVDLVALVASLEATVNGGEGADRVESALSGTFDLAAGDDLFVGRLSKPDLVALNTVLDSAQLSVIVADLHMHVIGGAGNDASRWGLSGVHDLGEGADAVSATIPREHIATLEAVFDPAQVAAIAASLDIEASGGEGTDTFVVGVRGKYLGGAGNDQFLVGTQDASLKEPQGDVQLDGGTGSDTFKFIGSNVGNVALLEDAEAGLDASSDTLDFSGLLAGSGGITLDLELTTPQTLAGGAMTLSLSSVTGIEQVIGTTGSDSIFGNARPNVLVGAFEEAHFPTYYAPRDSRIQFVLLDFDCFTNGEPTANGDGTFNCSVRDTIQEGEHVYSQVERDAIQAIMSRNYQGPDPSDPWLQFEFTQVAPIAGEYSTVYFNRTSPEVGGPGGLAEEIDFRNLNLSSRAYVQVNGILGEPDQPEDVSTNWITLSAKLASHELAHLAGLRHQDSFGPVGFGIHNPPGPDAYLPTYGGLAAAFETFDHLISSPASVGSTRFSDLNHLFFGEREAIKLTFNESGVVVNEDEAAPRQDIEIGGDTYSVQIIGELPGLRVPNTLDRGLYANKQFVVAAVDVVGELDEVGQHDLYSFAGQAGDVITIEVMSFSLNRYEEQNIDPVVALYDSAGNLLSFMQSDVSALNDDQFEAPDATIFDFVLPADDMYVFEVRAFTLIDTPEFDAQCGVDGPRAGSQACVGDTGKYEALVYRFQAVSVGDLGDRLEGRGGDDVLKGGSGFDVLKGGDGADVLDSGPAADGDTPLLTPALEQVADAFEGQPLHVSVSFTDTADATSGTLTVDFGDGSGLRNYLLTGNAGSVSHTYADDGVYTISVTIVSEDGVEGTGTMVVDVQNTLPMLDAGPDVSVAPGRQLSLAPATFSDDGFDYLPVDPSFHTNEDFVAFVDWGDGNVEPAAGISLVETPGGIGIQTVGTISATHVYAQRGTYTATVRVRDDDMADNTWVEDTFIVTVENYEPELTVVGDQVVDQARTFSITDLGTLTDDGDIFTYSIDWGDGTTVDTGQATIDAEGNATNATLASFDGQHVYAIAGSFQVTVTIEDVDGATDTDSFLVTSRKSLVALNTNAKGALSLSGNAEITIPGSVFVNSTSNKALSASGNAHLTASFVDVVGDVKASGNANINPAPITGTTAIVDPLAGLQLPGGLPHQGSFSCKGNDSDTISPGVYDQISASGSCQLVLASGIYVIDTKKFKVSGSASVTVDSDEGVFIYLAKGSLEISGNGEFDLQPLSEGPYRGLLIAQARSNTSTIKLSGNSRMSGIDGTIYAPSAQVSISGNGTVVAGIIADRIRVDGNGVSSLLSGVDGENGSNEGTVSSEGQLVGQDLWVAISDPDNRLSAAANQRVDSAMEDLNATFGQFGVNLVLVTGDDALLAEFSVLVADTSPCGAMVDGVLGCTDDDGGITLIGGWDWYEGESADGITTGQYDLHTIVMHELGHAIGLEHSIDVTSVMHYSLAAGEVKRDITQLDLEHLGDDDGGSSARWPRRPARNRKRHSSLKALWKPRGSAP